MKLRLTPVLRLLFLALMLAAFGAGAVEKPADKPTEKAAVKATDKPVDKAATKSTEKPADKPADKTAAKPTDKPANKTAAKPADTAPPKPPEVPAKAHLLIDFNSGRVLAESNLDQRLEPASLTKIMTAHVVFQALKAGRIQLTDEVQISEKAWRTGGSKTFVEIGNKIPVEVLLKGMIIQSGNDASVALAEHVAGSESLFAQLMNTEAQRLGMANTHFTNATGLPDPQLYITARDLATLAAATIREFPEYYPWYAIKEFTYHNIKQHNRNRLLWRDDAVDGVKTGHTETAGYCLVASAHREGMRLISVVMGSAGEEARARASLELLNYGLRFYETRELYPEGKVLQNVRVYKGSIKELPVGPQRVVAATVPRGQADRVEERVELQTPIMAPLAKGQAVGNVILSLGGEEIGRVPVVALEEVSEGGLWRRGVDRVLLWF